MNKERETLEKRIDRQKQEIKDSTDEIKLHDKKGASMVSEILETSRMGTSKSTSRCNVEKGSFVKSRKNCNFFGFYEKSSKCFTQQSNSQLCKKIIIMAKFV